MLTFSRFHYQIECHIVLPTMKIYSDTKCSSFFLLFLAIVCRVPALPEHAVVDKPHVRTVEFGETLTYQCRSGYRKTGVGSSTIVCKEDGHFTSKPALCERKYKMLTLVVSLQVLFDSRTHLEMFKFLLELIKCVYHQFQCSLVEEIAGGSEKKLF